MIAVESNPDHEPPRPREVIARPPTAREIAFDRTFRWATRILAGLSALLVVCIVVLVTKQAWPAMAKFGPGFITSTKWDAGKNQFGILPEIFGTVLSSFIGVALATISASRSRCS